MNINKRILAICSIAIAFLLIGVAFGVTIYQITITGNISVTGTSSLQIQDSTCSSTITNVSFGNIGAASGSTAKQSICVANTGNTDEFLVNSGSSNSFTISGLSSGLSFSWSPTGSIAPGGHLVVVLTITNNGASAGS